MLSFAGHGNNMEGSVLTSGPDDSHLPDFSHSSGGSRCGSVTFDAPAWKDIVQLVQNGAKSFPFKPTNSIHLIFYDPRELVDYSLS